MIMKTKHRVGMVKISSTNAHEYAGKTIAYGHGDNYVEGEVIGCNPGVDSGNGGAVIIGMPSAAGWELAGFDDNTLFAQATKYTHGMFAEDYIFTVIG